MQAAAHTPRAGDTVWVVGAPSPGDTSPWMSSGLVASTDSMVADRGRTDDERPPRDRGRVGPGVVGRRAGRPRRRRDRHHPLPRRRRAGHLRRADRDRVGRSPTISASTATPRTARSGVNGVNSPAGPRITEVVAGSAAEAAGVRVDDVIESVGNHEIDTMNDLMALVRHYRPGESVVLRLRRGTKTIRVSATLGSMVTR